MSQRHSAHKAGRTAWRSCEKKARYRTEGEAQHFANRAMQHRPQTTLRVYDCGICNGWHMTSKPLGDNS
jgi:hypothetical protein